MHGEYKVPGGKLVVADFDIVDGRYANVQVSGDFFLHPDSALDDIVAALEGQPANADEATLAGVVRAALDAEVQMFGISAEAVAVALRRGLAAGYAA